ncbi:MAG: 30S ribosomal protein S18 [Patescibacteria group bacterium]|nr:MAG: ribosomal protein S18 [Parcubacteria group bacterium Gr01-1014_19]
MYQQCILCSQNMENVDYKDTLFLKRFVSSQAKITDPRYTGTCALHQRKLAQAVKRARYMGLLAFVRR